MGKTTKYWRGLDELQGSNGSSSGEFVDRLPLEEVFSNAPKEESSRRDFLKYFGFSVSAVALAACNKTPIKYAVPYLDKPENVTPGMPLYYATSCNVYNEGFPVLAKVREGRPIKLDGNTLSDVSNGGLDAIGQASILSLYDTNRLKNPQIDGADKKDWKAVDNKVISSLNKAQNKGIAVLTRTNTSKLVQKAIDTFKNTYSNVEVVEHDPISYDGMLSANELSFGKRAIPSYDFSKAKVIFSFGADFLGTWISPVRFTAGYSAMRNLTKEKPELSKHIQIESLLSLTGSNADYRFSFTPDKVSSYLVSLHNLIASKAGVPSLPGETLELPGNQLASFAKELWSAKGESIIVVGSNSKADQLVANAINNMLGNYGTTINMSKAVNVSRMSDTKYATFERKLISGGYDAVVLLNTNPVYSSEKGSEVAEALGKTTLISTNLVLDESASISKINAPDNHTLESWDVLEPIEGHFLSVQPVISTVFNTRSAAASLMTWAGSSLENNGMRAFYEKEVKAIGASVNKFKHDGVFDKSGSEYSSYNSNGVAEAGSEIKNRNNDGLTLLLYQKVGVKDGYHAMNPWCHELPDPITKVTYDNYVSISKIDADTNKWEQGDYLKVEANGYTIELPLLIQPGQSPKTIGIALGYGRTIKHHRKNDLVDLGKNAYPFSSSTALKSYEITGVSLTKINKASYEFAQTQTHHTIEGRDIVREATLEEYKSNPKVTNDHGHPIISLWDDIDYSKGHHWGMAIDMNKCNGCGSCIVSCHVENNVPVVGRDEVRRRREMHWLRIDRYYAFKVDEDKEITVKYGVFGVDSKVEKGDYTTEIKKIEGLEVAKKKEGKAATHYNNVQVVHMPMMCQHCDNAPCESVCPVLATTHSSEGLNQMTYNRCIGTKYCGNNCPYKVRRFNWFRYNMNDKYDYHFNNELGRMVLNPDVTVRSRGVMEKCSFCVQNIQSAKLLAKRENRKLEDGNVQVACANSCSSNAIVFGDRNDPKSEIYKLFRNERSYKVIEEVNTRPSIGYLTRIWNRESKTTEKHS